MSWTQERARVASLTRSRTPDDPELVDARRALRTERMAEYISTKLAEAPPLTAEQKSRLSALFAEPTR